MNADSPDMSCDAGSMLTAEVSRSAVRANLRTLRDRTRDGAKLCAVVKANAYGLGIECLLPTIAAEADVLAVATPSEAIELRRLGWDGPVLMFFSPCMAADESHRADALETVIAADVTMTVVSPDELAPIVDAAKRVGRPAACHVKVDTGMGRSGVSPGLAPRLVEGIRSRGGVRLTGMYTHFATADENDLSFAREQLALFGRVVADCGGRKGLTLHAANSAGICRLPEAHLDMVRAGIAVYGYAPAEDMPDAPPLRPALRLTAPLMQARPVPAGSRCGYGLTHRFPRETRIGLVPAGYADGYPRCLSNRSSMRVGGRDVPVVGRVSMDQTILDLSAAPHAGVGDEVEVISDDPSVPHSVEALARLAGTISYEIISRLGRRVRRVAVE